MITCTFEDGNTASLRHAIVDAVVVKDDKVLLVKRSQKLSTEPGKWALVGGFLNRDETAEQAIEREILEEAGCTVRNIRLLTVVDNPKRPGEDRQNIKFVYICEAVEQKDEHDWEVEDVQWFEMNNLPEVIAFDHREYIDMYKAVKMGKLSLPDLPKVS